MSASTCKKNKQYNTLEETAGKVLSSAIAAVSISCSFDSSEEPGISPRRNELYCVSGESVDSAGYNARDN